MNPKKLLQGLTKTTPSYGDSPEPEGRTQDERYSDLYNDIVHALLDLDIEVSKRNSYMNKRYRAVYQDGIYHDIDIAANEWFAEYNLLRRVVDIQTSQLFGRGFNVVSDYSKEDLSAYEQNPAEKEAMKLKNKRLKAQAELRQKLVKAIITDNGGMQIFEDGGRIGSAMGMTVYKVAPDVKNKKAEITLLETPQNYRAGWSDNNFRERDFDAFVYQISLSKANRLYKDRLPEGANFRESRVGSPLEDSTAADINTNNGIRSLEQPTNTDRRMVTVVEFVGYLSEWGGDGESIYEVEDGEETRFSALCVGGYIVDVETDEKLLPRYFPINNQQVPRQPWGDADIVDSLIDINKEIVRLMADMGVWADKNLWKILMGKGLSNEQMLRLKGKRRTTKMLGMAQDQTIEEVQTSSQPLTEFARLVDQKIDLFVRIAGIGRVLLDDPTINANSNQALMTTLKGVVDIVESKQKRWTPALREMFRFALELSAQFAPAIKPALTDDPNWDLDIEWPPVLRREDATYQTMLLNMFNANAMSLETYLQKAMGDGAADEIDRLRDESTDPLLLAILSKQLPLLAQQLIAPPPPPGSGEPDIKYNVSVKADATADPVANADLIRVVDPQLPDEGVASTAVQGMTPSPQALGSQASPTLTADQNTGQAASQPGSGAPAVSASGAAAQANQNAGR